MSYRSDAGGVPRLREKRRLTKDRKSTRLNSSHANISYAVLFFNDTATTEIYTLSLHDALPIFLSASNRLLTPIGPCVSMISYTVRTTFGLAIIGAPVLCGAADVLSVRCWRGAAPEREAAANQRSEEHTSELQSRQYLVCRPFF